MFPTIDDFELWLDAMITGGVMIEEYNKVHGLARSGPEPQKEGYRRVDEGFSR